MAANGLVVLAATAALGLACGTAAKAARDKPRPYVQYVQTEPVPEAQPRRRARPRIQVNPGRLLYRQCTDWYAIEDRPSGTVVVPRMRCWWVRG